MSPGSPRDWLATVGQRAGKGESGPRDCGPGAEGATNRCEFVEDLEMREGEANGF